MPLRVQRRYCGKLAAEVRFRWSLDVSRGTCTPLESELPLRNPFSSRAFPNRFHSNAQVLVVRSAAGAATNVPAISNFNVQATCNELQKVPEALSVDSGQPDAIRHCLDHEQQARDQLSREWNKFKTADRNLCVGESRSGSVAPAYSELESCLQMTRDTRQLNNQQTSENSGNSTGPAAKSAPGPTAQSQ